MSWVALFPTTDELLECPPSSPAVLWFVNVRERKPRQKKRKQKNNIDISNRENATSRFRSIRRSALNTLDQTYVTFHESRIRHYVGEYPQTCVAWQGVFKAPVAFQVDLTNALQALVYLHIIVNKNLFFTIFLLFHWDF